jgi:hypothetical protein
MPMVEIGLHGNVIQWRNNEFCYMEALSVCWGEFSLKTAASCALLHFGQRPVEYTVTGRIPIFNRARMEMTFLLNDCHV